MKNTLYGLSMAVGHGPCQAVPTAPSKPLTFDQLGQFSNAPLNAQSYRISFQARPKYELWHCRRNYLGQSRRKPQYKTAYRFLKC